MTIYVLEEDGLVAHRLNRFEKIEHVKRTEMTGTYKAEDGTVRTIALEASATRIEVLGCPVIPAAPGHHVLRPVSTDPTERRLHRISVVGWHVTSVCAYPVTVDFGSSSADLYEDVIEFPDGHIEYANRRYNSAGEYCDAFGKIAPENTSTYIPAGITFN